MIIIGKGSYGIVYYYKDNHNQQHVIKDYIGDITCGLMDDILKDIFFYTQIIDVDVELIEMVEKHIKQIYRLNTKIERRLRVYMPFLGNNLGNFKANLALTMDDYRNIYYSVLQ